MKFNDTTGQQGLIQDAEFWTNLGNAAISGDSSFLLPLFTRLLNSAYDEVLPIIFGADSKWQWDDPNQTDRPIATTNVVAGQPDYSFVSDNDGNSVLSILGAYIMLPDGTYRKLQAVDSQSDPHTSRILAQNPSNTGIPTRYDKYDTSIVLDPIPSVSMANGLKVLFSRTPSYFVAGDTTKQPGIPVPFHRLLSCIASRDYVAVHKSDGGLLQTINAKIAEMKQQLALHMGRRAGDERTVLRVRRESSR